MTTKIEWPNTQCRKCGIVQPLSNYDRNKSAKDGHISQCKSCRSEYDLANRDRRRELRRDYKREYDKDYRQKEYVKRSTMRAIQKYRAANPKTQKARDAVTIALRSGRLTRSPCVVCGETKTHAHHDNYSRPLEVVWLCPLHHKERHRGLENRYG